MGLFGGLLSEVAKTAVAAAAEGAAAGVAEGLSNGGVQQGETQRSVMEDKIDYTPTYVEYAEMIHNLVEGNITKFGLDGAGRKKIIRLGLLDAYVRYCDILEDTTEDMHNANWQRCFQETCEGLDAIGVDDNNRPDLIQVVKMIGGSMFDIYKKMRDDIENKSMRMWVGQARYLRCFRAGNRPDTDEILDFRQAFAAFLCGIVSSDDIVSKALDSDYVSNVKLKWYS